MVDSDYEVAVGQMVGEYRAVRKIGEGAFGKVYAALQPVIGKSVAIKVLNPALSANKEMVTRFADEARAVNQIRHRNIIDIFSFGTLPNGLHYFVMELLEGMTFQQYLRKTGPLDPATALQLLWPVGRALGAAHKAGIAHRDLKPENVFLMMDEDGTAFPKLLDFGIAKLMSESERSHRTQTGMLLGTPVYMAPEQCRALQVDHRADIYAFGIMTHEVLTGRRPFDAPNVMDVIMKQISDPPPRMSACRPDLPAALDAPVLHMLEKSAAKRPQTMQAALEELAEAARSAGIASPMSGREAVMSSVPTGPVASARAPVAPTGPGPSVDTNAWLQNQAGYPAGDAVQARSAAVSQASLGAAPMSAGAPGSTGGPQASWGAQQGSSSMAVPSLAVPSGAAPMAPSMAQPMTPSMAQPMAPSMAQPMPQGDTSTMLSQGMARGSSPSFPGNGPVSQGQPGYGPVSQGQPGYGPVSQGQPGYGPPPSVSYPGAPAEKSKRPVYLGIGGGVLVLGGLGIAALAMFGSGGAGASGAPSGSADHPSAVQIGGEPPKVGRKLDQELDLVLSLDINGCTNGRSVSEEVRQHRQYTVTTTAVNDWSATRGEVAYGQSYTQVRENKAQGQPKDDPVAEKTWIATSEGGAFAVSSPDGSAITPEVTRTVKSDVGDMFLPRPDVFKHPLSRGDSLTLPSEIAASFLGMTDSDDDTTTKLENTVIRLTTVDRGQKRVTFDTDFNFVQEDKKSGISFSGPVTGTMTLDLPTGRAVAGRLSGPLEGTVATGGVRCKLKGLLTFSMKASLGD